MWKLLYDILRFNACARELVVDGNDYLEDCPVAEYPAREGYSDTFHDDYLIVSFSFRSGVPHSIDLLSRWLLPIWSTPPDKCLLGFPVQALVRPFLRSGSIR